MTKREELRKKMLIGDYVVVGRMLNISNRNAFVSFQRPNSKLYPAIVASLEQIIENREKLLTQNINHDENN